MTGRGRPPAAEPSGGRSRPLAAVLAGGRSRRMGAPKATMPFGGRPLIERPLAAAAAAGLEAIVVAKRGSTLPPLEVPVWHEPDEPRHPLTGLVAALERAQGPVLALACDMPFVPPGLLAGLAATPGCAAPRLAGRLEPFPGRYEPAGLPALRAALREQAPVTAVLAALAPRELAEDELCAFGDPSHLLAGVNTPDELAAAEALLTG